MKEWNFKVSDNKGEAILGLGFSFAFMGIAALILILRLLLFPKIKFSDYVNNSFLFERIMIISPALAIVPYAMKLMKKYAIKNYHIYEDKEILKIENDNRIIELSYNAIKNIKFDKKEEGIASCYKLTIKTSRKNLKFIARPKVFFNFFGRSDENDFYSLEDFYFFLKEKLEK